MNPTKASGSLPTSMSPSKEQGDMPSPSPMENIVPPSPTTSNPIDSSTTLNPTPTPVQSILPPLTWIGVDNCSFCPICTGDCDVDTDCNVGLRCFKRGDEAKTQVPGCAVGGVGDIPGADYCYDPNSNGGAESGMPSITVGSMMPVTSPTVPPLLP